MMYCRDSKIGIFVLVLILLNTGRLKAQENSYDISHFGAVGNGVQLNTIAIQKAIDKAAAGGGTVVIPAGNFVTGPLVLKSGVHLFLSEGAFLLGSVNRRDYGQGAARSLISAREAENIKIFGKGTIDGRGGELAKNILKLLSQGEIEDPEWKSKRPTEVNRPVILTFQKCQHIELKDIEIKNSSAWVQCFDRCEDVEVDNIKVESTAYWNNDGIDIVNSKNVRIMNSYFDVADDAICLKSEGASGTCENVWVKNCVTRSSASGFKLGTGSHGGFKHIFVDSLTVFNTFRTAIAIESVDGGFLEDVHVKNVTAINVGAAFFIRLGHRNTSQKYSTLNNVTLENLKATIPSYKPDIGYPIEGPKERFKHNVFPSAIVGLPDHPVEHVELKNIKIIYEGTGDSTQAYAGIGRDLNVPEAPAGYPEFSMFGELPAWGVYIRHAKGLTLNNIHLTSKAIDYRPAIVLDDVPKATLTGINIPNIQKMPIIYCNASPDIKFSDLHFSGMSSESILMD